MSFPVAKRVLVTGASGFIGRHTVSALLAAGYHVTGLLRASSTPPFSQTERLTWVTGDMRDLESLVTAVEGADAVVHLAAKDVEGDESYAVNVEGARHLIEAARRRGLKRIVNISTQAVKIEHKGTYGATKAEAEQILGASGLHVTTLRLSVVYGPGAGGVFAKIVAYVRRLPVVPVIGSGRWRCRPVHVGDVAEVILRCLENDRTVNQTYEVGGPEEVTLNQLIDAIAAELHLKRRKFHIPVRVGLFAAKALARLMTNPPFTVSNVLGSTQATECDISSLARDLNFAPLPLSRGLPLALPRDHARGRAEPEPSS